MIETHDIGLVEAASKSNNATAAKADLTLIRQRGRAARWALTAGAVAAVAIAPQDKVSTMEMLGGAAAISSVAYMYEQRKKAQIVESYTQSNGLPFHRKMIETATTACLDGSRMAMISTTVYAYPDNNEALSIVAVTAGAIATGFAVVYERMAHGAYEDQIVSPQ